MLGIVLYSQNLLIYVDASYLILPSSSIQTKYNDDLVLERASDIQEKLSAIEKSMDKEVDNHSVEDLHISPLLVMLSRELSQWRDRVCSILESLQVMINAVKGEEALCGEMERTYQNLLCNVLPRAWTVSCLNALAD